MATPGVWLAGVVVGMGHVAHAGPPSNRSALGPAALLLGGGGPMGLGRTLLSVTSTLWGMEVLET